MTYGHYGDAANSFGAGSHPSDPGQGQAAQPAGSAPQPAMELPPMGWYDDPAGSGQERYWDGNAWTHNLRPAELASGAMPAGGQYAPTQGGQPYLSNPYGGSDPYGAQQVGVGGVPIAQPGEPTTADGVPLSGWWSRVGAAVIDWFVLQTVNSVLTAPFTTPIISAFEEWMYDAANSGGDVPSPFDPQYGLVEPLVWMLVLALAINFLYGLLMLGFKGATLGQMATGIRVVPTDQGRTVGGLSWGKATARHAVFVLLNMIPIIRLISYLMPLWTPRRQTIHDMIAGTQVVRTR